MSSREADYLRDELFIEDYKQVHRYLASLPDKEVTWKKDMELAYRLLYKINIQGLGHPYLNYLV